MSSCSQFAVSYNPKALWTGGLQGDGKASCKLEAQQGCVFAQVVKTQNRDRRTRCDLVVELS